ncbi:MAG: hypothetical protein AABM40_15540, partial [Chloroflexota bacterium]
MTPRRALVRAAGAWLVAAALIALIVAIDDRPQRLSPVTRPAESAYARSSVQAPIAPSAYSVPSVAV